MSVVKHKKNYAIISFGLLPFLLLSGCSLMNPFVSASKHPYSTPRGSGSFASAVNYANSVRMAYEDALENQAWLTSGMGAVLIPVSAVIGYKAIAGANSHNIAAWTFGGAGLLGGGTYLHSQPRQMIYASAASAISCAISAMEPLDLDPAEVKILSDSLASLPSQMNELQVLLGEVETSDSTVYSKYTQADNDAIHRSKILLENAPIALNNGIAARLRIERAGNTLINTVDMIRGIVNRQLVATMPDPQAIAAPLGGLVQIGGAPNSFSPLISEMKKPVSALSEKAEEPGKPQSPAEKLSNKQSALEATLSKINKIVEAIGDAPSASSLKTCNVDIDKIETNIRLVPPDTVITVSPGTPFDRTVLVVGGKPPYSAYLMAKSSPPGRVEVSVVVDVGGVFCKDRGR